MEKKTSAPVRRPRKAAMAVMCVVTALLLVVNAAAAVLIPPNVTMINNFFNKGPSEAETVEAGEASAAMTQEVASEGIILLDNKNSALPLAQGSKVNLFGYGSRDNRVRRFRLRFRRREQQRDHGPGPYKRWL